MNLPKAFGAILRELREGRKLSQEQLALQSDLDRTYISMLERGRRQPTLTTIFTLSKTLQHRPSELIARVEKYVQLKSR